MKIAVTGANGLIGRDLARRHLAAGDDVRVLVRDTGRVVEGLGGARLYEIDMAASEGNLAGFLECIDVLYHCAAELRNPARMTVVNVDGTRRLLQAAAGRIGRWVQVSTVAVYGRARAGVITEDSPLAPADAYARSKAMADALVADFSGKSGFEHVILRACAVLGPGMPGSFLYRVIDLLDRGLFAPVGAPGALVSLIPVSSVAGALSACATSPLAARRTYNLVEQCTVEHLVEVCCEALGRKPPRWRIPEGSLRAVAWLAERLAPGKLTQEQIDILTNRVRYDAQRAANELRYNCVMNLDDAIRELAVEWRRLKK